MTARKPDHWAHAMVALGIVVTLSGVWATAQRPAGPERLSVIALAGSSFWYGWLSRSRTTGDPS